MGKHQDKTGWTLKWVLGIGIPIFAMVYLSFSLVVFQWWARFAPWDIESVAHYGAAFGILNAFFSGAALLAVAATLWQSQKQLAIQQQELKASVAALESQHKELKAQREELQVQNQHFARQQISSDFFNLLRSYQTAISEYSMKWNEGIYTGHDALVRLIEGWARYLRSPMEHEAQLADIIEAYVTIEGKKSFRPMALRCFRMLEELLGHIDRQPSALLPDADKSRFISIVVSQLSIAEQNILAIWSLDDPTGMVSAMCWRYRLLRGFQPAHDKFKPIRHALHQRTIRFAESGVYQYDGSPVEPAETQDKE